MSDDLVVDASLVAAFLLREPGGSKFDPILSAVAEGKAALHVPALFPFEMSNILLMAERRRRITASQREGLCGELALIPFVADPPPSAAVSRRLMALAAEHRLTAYDAAYLELSERLDVPLVTLDQDLLALRKRVPRVR